MNRRRARPTLVQRTSAVIALVAVACQATPATPPTTPSAAASPTPASAGPTSTATGTVASLAPVPAGRILFHRETPDGVEHYFTVRTDGTDERLVYETRDCECAHWMADGKRVMTVEPTAHGTLSFTTYLFDGSDRVVVDNPMKALNLAPGATTSDGRLIAFNGWVEGKPADTGLWLSAPDLSDLRLVIPLQQGWLATEPFGISPDGARIVFFVETGPRGDINHAGDNYVVRSDGTGLRRLSNPGATLGFIGMPTISMSPDGRQAAFATSDTVYVVDLAGGDARPITAEPGFAWAVSWSPTGEWLAYAKFHGRTSVISLIRPDGTDQREISGVHEADEANAPVWSPDGKHLVVARDSDASVDGPNDLWIMDLDGRYLGQVTHEPSHYGTYSWAPEPG